MSHVQRMSGKSALTNIDKEQSLRRELSMNTLLSLPNYGYPGKGADYAHSVSIIDIIGISNVLG